jgi:hypothetical protein
MAEGENMIGEPGGICIVFFDTQLGLVIKEPVKNVCCIAYGRVDYLGVKRRVLVGKMGVEEHSGFRAVALLNSGVVLASGSNLRKRKTSRSLHAPP